MMRPAQAAQSSPYDPTRSASWYAMTSLGDEFPQVDMENYVPRETLPIGEQLQLAKDDITNAKEEYDKQMDNIIASQVQEKLKNDLMHYAGMNAYSDGPPEGRSFTAPRDIQKDEHLIRSYKTDTAREVLRDQTDLNRAQRQFLMRVNEDRVKTLADLALRVSELEVQRENDTLLFRRTLPKSVDDFARLEALDMQMALEVGKYLQGNTEVRAALMRKYELDMYWSQEDADELVKVYAENGELRQKVQTLVQAKSKSVDPRK